MGTYQGTFPNIKTKYTRADMIDEMMAFAKKYADDNSYIYKKWTDDIKTHQCPICHPELQKTAKYRGWNCIGFATACIYHATKDKKITCSCSGLLNDSFAAYDNLTLAKWKKRNGPNWKLVAKQNEKISIDVLQKGDIILCYDGKTYKHTVVYAGSGYIFDATSGKTQISKRKYTSLGSVPKIAFRYTDAGNLTRNYMKLDDSGSEVKNLQMFLNWALDNALKVDGDYSSLTQQAVKDFQKLNGIEQTGEFGEITLAAAKKFDKKECKPDKPVDIRPYSGELPENLKVVKTTQEVIDDTIAWAKWIASNNDFHYGYGDEAHHNGCYFCGTQPKVKKNAGIKEYKKTYCCNPFIGAAWAHGGQVKKAMELCKAGKSWDFGKGKGYDKSKLFDNIKVKKEKDLKPGDILCNDHHVVMYIGDDKIVEASGNDKNKPGSTEWNNSIRVRKLSTKYSGKWTTKFLRFHRFNGKVNRNIDIEFGEFSERVKQIQQFLNWYGDYGIEEKGHFYDETKSALKKFQKAEGLKETGAVNAATLKKMKEVKK